jgi:endonuclease YncB( thermonuclease family)
MRNPLSLVLFIALIAAFVTARVLLEPQPRPQAAVVAVAPAPPKPPPKPAAPVLPPLPEVEVKSVPETPPVEAEPPREVATAPEPAPRIFTLPRRPVFGDSGNDSGGTSGINPGADPFAAGATGWGGGPGPILGAHAAIPAQFAGEAHVTGPDTFLIGNIPVQLYGVRRPLPSEICGGVRCDDVAEAALRARLAAGPVSCRVPTPSSGVVAFALCLDSRGADLAGALVGDGLARADTRQSYDYVGAEHVAKDLGKGIWGAR